MSRMAGCVPAAGGLPSENSRESPMRHRSLQPVVLLGVGACAAPERPHTATARIPLPDPAGYLAAAEDWIVVLVTTDLRGRTIAYQFPAPRP